MNKKFLSHWDVIEAVNKMYAAIPAEFCRSAKREIKLYGVPRGGIPIVYLLWPMDEDFTIVNNAEEADIIVDDIMDSGETMRAYKELYPEKLFIAAFAKTDRSEWIVFPWELEEGNDEGVEANITRILQYVGEDPTREGLLETPARVVKAWEHWTNGYKVNVEGLFKSFSDGGEQYDQMLVVKDIPFYSNCEHHMAPFFGTATIAYIPDKKIIGLSKLNRVVDAFSRRLQVQERLTCQIADAVMNNLAPKGVGVRITARHMCMESRGVCQSGHGTITTALRGCFYDDHKCREEFLLAAK